MGDLHVEFAWGFEVAAKLERGYFENQLVLGISVHLQEAYRKKHMCTACTRAMSYRLSLVSLGALVSTGSWHGTKGN